MQYHHKVTSRWSNVVTAVDPKGAGELEVFRDAGFEEPFGGLDGIGMGVSTIGKEVDEFVIRCRRITAHEYSVYFRGATTPIRITTLEEVDASKLAEYCARILDNNEQGHLDYSGNGSEPFWFCESDVELDAVEAEIAAFIDAQRK